ncbi:MAG: choice-of-anchor Q domain-containing protein [Geminicoccaceae bacterium]
MQRKSTLLHVLLGALVLLAALVVPPSPSQAASFFVDRSVATSGDGRSWATAWKSFAKVRWSSIRPGDTLYVSGGASGKTYTESLTVGASGSAGSPITIRPGLSAGHSGPVIIDGQNLRDTGIFLSSRNHVLVTGFDLRNHPGAGIGVKYATAGVRIENNKIYSGDPGDSNARGIDVRNCVGTDAVIVRSNAFTTPPDTLAQTDGIWSSANNGVIFENNRIVISNSNTWGHSDGIQSYLDVNITIRGNWFEQANNATTDNHGMWLSNTRNGGVLKVYNNVVLVPNLTADSAVTHFAESTWNENGTARFWNNTVIGGKRGFNLYKSPNAQAWNNIVWPAAGGFAFVIIDGTIPAANIDRNLIWAPNATVAYVGTSNLTYAGWKARGYDRSGVNADPLFTSLAAEDFTLQAGSPAIDAGAEFAEVTTDIAGTPRPQGAATDIGAYERIATTASLTPIAATTGTADALPTTDGGASEPTDEPEGEDAGTE